MSNFITLNMKNLIKDANMTARMLSQEESAYN